VTDDALEVTLTDLIGPRWYTDNPGHVPVEAALVVRYIEPGGGEGITVAHTGGFVTALGMLDAARLWTGQAFLEGDDE
jgi:hypothetical protein